jgi:hypothetical protein
MQSSIVDLKTRVDKLGIHKVLEKGDIINVERKLQIICPHDFCAFAEICDYEYLSDFEWLNISLENQQSVIHKTVSFRNSLNLPNKYVVLMIQDDVSVVLIETQDSPDKPSPVIWCDLIPDFFNLCEGKQMEQNPTIWPSFTDFFEYLVEQEEAKHTKE